MALVSVLAIQTSLAVHPIADLNASSVQSAVCQQLASVKSVWILVREFADLMPDVKLSITIRFANVQWDMLEIRLFVATSNLK
jgi:hypothetical protein